MGATERWNAGLVLAAALAGGLLLFFEGYAGRLRWFFVLYAAATLVWDLWIAVTAISRRRLVFLSLAAGLVGYMTQVVGVGNRIWVYTGPARSFYFVPFTFVLAAVAMYGLVRYPLGILAAPLDGIKARWPNLLLAVALVVALCVAAGRFSSGLNPGFWAYYLLLGSFLLYGSRRLAFRSLAAVVVAGWIVGLASEWLGSQSGLWAFQTGSGHPPLFLVLGSWPTEFFLYYASSGIVAGDPLDQVGGRKPAEAGACASVAGR